GGEGPCLVRQRDRLREPDGGVDAEGGGGPALNVHEGNPQLHLRHARLLGVHVDGWSAQDAGPAALPRARLLAGSTGIPVFVLRVLRHHHESLRRLVGGTRWVASDVVFGAGAASSGVGNVVIARAWM